MSYFHIGPSRRTRNRVYLTLRMQELLRHVQITTKLGNILSWKFEVGSVATYPWPRHASGAVVAGSGLRAYWETNGVIPPLCFHGSKVGNKLTIPQAQCKIRPTRSNGVTKYCLSCSFEDTDGFCGYVAVLPSRPQQSDLVHENISNNAVNAHRFMQASGSQSLLPFVPKLSDANIFATVQQNPAAPAPLQPAVPAVVAQAAVPVAAPIPLPFVIPPPAGLWAFSKEYGPPLLEELPFITHFADYRALICLTTTTGLSPDHFDALLDSLEKCQYCCRSFLGPAFEAHHGVDGIHRCERTSGSGFGSGVGCYKGLTTWTGWSSPASKSYRRRRQLELQFDATLPAPCAALPAQAALAAPLTMPAIPPAPPSPYLTIATHFGDGSPPPAPIDVDTDIINID
ncbi:hypothetical protein K439DRAFT_1616573 [Ramaria rubella]|nr:hypothetical protein K439DRAFT_1616573 [Ramaria rubella]